MAVPGSTLADLQNRIIAETNRDDLADVLASQLNQSIYDSIEKYANERFWFNESRVVTTLSPGGEYTSLPSGYEFITDVYIQVGGVFFWLQKKTNEYLESLYAIPQIGQPIYWAPYQTNARVWPTPNTTYPMVWMTISDVTPALVYSSTIPDTANQSNNWTVDGQRLICAQAKQFLYRDVFKDPDNANAAQAAINDAYAELKGITNRRLSTGFVRASWG
jgi:hypothetical protein